MWIFFQVVLESPFVFTFLLVMMVAFFGAFMLLQDVNPSNEEAVFFGTIARTLLGLFFIFFAITSIAFLVEGYYQVRAEDKELGVQRDVFGFEKTENGKNPLIDVEKKPTEEEEKKKEEPRVEAIKMGAKAIHSGGWTE